MFTYSCKILLKYNASCNPFPEDVIFCLYFQYDILEESLGALERLGKSNLSKMKSLFPQNKPSDGLGKADQ